MTSPKPKKKVKKIVQAWLIVDNGGEILSLGNRLDGVMDRLLIVYSSREAAEKAWGGFKVVPFTITYTL